MGGDGRCMTSLGSGACALGGVGGADLVLSIEIGVYLGDVGGDIEFTHVSFILLVWPGEESNIIPSTGSCGGEGTNGSCRETRADPWDVVDENDIEVILRRRGCRVPCGGLLFSYGPFRELRRRGFMFLTGCPSRSLRNDSFLDRLWNDGEGPA